MKWVFSFLACLGTSNKLHKINNNKIKKKSGLKLDILCVGIWPTFIQYFVYVRSENINALHFF